MNDTTLLIARLLMGVPFVIWGALKLRGDEPNLAVMLTKLGLPDAKLLGSLVGLCELVGGVAVIVGYPVHIVGWLLGVWCLVTGVVVHRQNQTLLLSHIVMAGGYIALAAVGAGAFRLL